MFLKPSLHLPPSLLPLNGLPTADTAVLELSLLGSTDVCGQTAPWLVSLLKTVANYLYAVPV
ncbi:hypothetical protein [Sporisorium scitamineum]|uniref:Uncharacterized protein n=1 Tax=Sporisorium scitamineum TaxID=49012 RepID=A0A0F7S0R6_9BASI|nr:hypothetical protein [Sporisorium scitamineum]